MSRHFTVRQDCLVPHKQQIKKKRWNDQSWKWNSICLVSMSRRAHWSRKLSTISKHFLIAFKNSPSADRTSCVDWPRKMSNQRQHMLTELQFLPLADVECTWAADGNCTVTTDHWSPPNYPRYSDTDPIFTMTLRTQGGHKSIISRTWSMFYSIQLS